jgi:uncharacterized integral membrane protein
MKLSTLLLAPPTLGAALVLAVANRSPVRFSIDPFSLDSPMIAFEMPLFVLIFAGILTGVLIGGTSAWLGQTTWRKKARKKTREVKHLEKNLTHQQVDAAGSAPKAPAATSKQLTSGRS